MRTPTLLAVAGLGVAVAVGLGVARRAAGADDEAPGVRRQFQAFVTAWNAHDPKAMAAVFAEDGDAVHPAGRHATGRAEVEKLFADEHTGKGRMSGSAVEVKAEAVRFPTADVAVSDAQVVVTGAVGTDGSRQGPLEVHVTNVWRKSGGAWWVFSSRPYVRTRPPSSDPAPGKPDAPKSWTGRLEKMGPSIHMQGTHRLVDGERTVALLESKRVDLVPFEGKRVTVTGTASPTVEGRQILVDVAEVKEAP